MLKYALDMVTRLSDYEAALGVARENFLSPSGLSTMLDDDVEQDTLKLYDPFQRVWRRR